MPIIDLQRRLAEAGRIRIGQQVPTGNGRSRPEKLETFRLTSSDQHRIRQAADLFGGEARPWSAPAGQQWEVVTTADAIDVIVPPSDMSFSQHYELWSAGGCQRRCDGGTESISDGPCVCDPDARECDIHTRLSVMLRDLPGLGVWRIDTQGYYAAVELQGAVGVIQMAAGRGQMLPARLRLEQRQVKRPGQQTRRFAVPVLDVEVSPGQLIGGGTEVRQISAGVAEQPVDGAARLTPVPASLPAAPVASVAEQAAAANEPKTRAKRKNSAAPIPSTGLKPRTAGQAARPAPGAVSEAAPVAEEMITRAQQNKLHAQLGEFGINERPDKLTTVGLLARRPAITSSNDLTKAQASTVIDVLERALADVDPPKALDGALAAAEANEDGS
ncbi:hypothetical protein ALI144C_44980 [Actinosynnema sp. ALI-1.44]|uniref:recombination directionality factor n=1 Tax=Actinosynnema sp. ALI-1.44 TaxID=1933779 RepID=UPI00097BEDE5|nr:hypothetical protein [Actinosynnema sp. ALI-1.44]ONI73107.1 hypothetical protein ALI144C_44980 [Actinosynnema sp. ALI-1.44]